MAEGGRDAQSELDDAHAASALSLSSDVRYTELIQICNDNSKELAAIDILADFRHEKLKQPNFEVYPQMQQVDVDDYYKVCNDNISFQESRNEVDHKQLTKELGFHHQGSIQAKSIGIGDVMASICQSKQSGSPETVGVTAIVASAGSGKSTLTRRIARQALGVSSAIDEVKQMPACHKRMVHYIELKDMEVKGEIKPSKFLFGGLYENEIEEEQAFKWLDEHQSEAVLIFDGLDQARWDFEQRNLRKIENHEKASYWTVMYNILSRNILCLVKVFIASREFRISELPAMARPETIITLNGLPLEDAHRLFAFLLKGEGEDLWQKIEMISPILLTLVSVPVLLILTAVVMGRDPSRSPPTTVTELFNKFILDLQSVENIRNRKEILSIVDKLKALAFECMVDGRVVFKEMDLKLSGVSVEEVQDLMTTVPGNNLLSRHLMLGDFTFSFCHQSIQEYLAAIFVSEMTLDEFSRFDEEHMHEERWSVVRRFVTGVVFCKPQNDLYRVSDQTKKQQVLASSILSQLRGKFEEKDKYIRMELYTAIYESGDADLWKELYMIDASNISLNRDEVHVLGSLLAAKRKIIWYLNLFSCRIDDEILYCIARYLKEPIRVHELKLAVNNLSATALRSFLGRTKIESLFGKLNWHHLQLSANGSICQLKHSQDVIEISGGAEGHFSIKESTLVIRGKTHFAQALYLGTLFESNFSEPLYPKQSQLPELTKHSLGKISKICLDCKNGGVDWSLIERSLETLQVDVLDIIVNGHYILHDYDIILERARTISVFGNIHVMFFIAKNSRRVAEACRQKKIEYIRCIFKEECFTSLEDISSLVNNSNLKKVSLVYINHENRLGSDDFKKVQKIANDHGTELEVLMWKERNDAWKLVDDEFCEFGYKGMLYDPTSKLLDANYSSLQSNMIQAEEEESIGAVGMSPMFEYYIIRQPKR